MVLPTQRSVTVRKLAADRFSFEGIPLPSDFIFLKKLGQGAVGNVYLVRQKGTQKLFALKALRKEEMLRKRKIERVLTELQILSQADHPFIVSVYGTFQTQSCLFFLLEYCAGGDLYRVLQEQPSKRFKEATARFYAVEIVLAFEYLHVLGFVYRDLKPENILLHETGHVMLADFDLAKSLPRLSSQSVAQHMIPSRRLKRGGKPLQELDITNSFVGTAEYLAPEVVKGQGHTSSVDWWTLGVLLYEMLFGKSPFQGVDYNSTFSNILNRPLQIPKEPQVSEECRDFIFGLLNHDESQRLGRRGDATEIKTHPFFKGIDWNLVRNQSPPIVPEKPDIPSDAADDALVLKNFQSLLDSLVPNEDPFQALFPTMKIVKRTTSWMTPPDSDTTCDPPLTPRSEQRRMSSIGKLAAKFSKLGS